jgi:EpsD family peptidyl-prolyl cis-trans isomerase
MQQMHRIGMGILVMAVAVYLAGCSDKKKGKEASQVAVKVNNDEITVHQINQELSKLGNVAPEQAKRAANQVLRSIVDQQVFVQKAIEEKMDRDPQVVQSLDAARRQILAQSYIQKLTANVAKPTDAEIADYYQKNPALFAERRIYRLQEVIVQTTPSNVETIKAELAKAAQFGGFIQWLKDQRIPARAAQSVKAAEQLPMELLPRLAKMQNGQALNMMGGNMMNIVFVADSQSQPRTLEQSRADIERFVTTAKKRGVAMAELKKLREKAKIEYLGDYSDAGKDAAPAAPAADQGAVERGAAGLK